MNLFVISDLHISNDHDPNYFALLSLMKNRINKEDIFVLAGDIFDLLIGNKSLFTQRYSRFIQLIQEMTLKGIEIHYIEGNHDFYLKQLFRNVNGITIHPHHVTLKLGDLQFYIAHGDTVDRSNVPYLILRVILRNMLVKHFIHWIPNQWIDQIGKWSSQASRSRRLKKSAHSSVVKLEWTRKVYRKFALEKFKKGYDFVILGHSHDLDEMPVLIHHRSCHYLNMGYPKIQKTLIRWSSSQKKISREDL